MRTLFTVVGIFRKEVRPMNGPVQSFHSQIKLKTGITVEQVNMLGAKGLEEIANTESLQYCKRDRFQRVWMTDWELQSEQVSEAQVA